MSEPVVPSLLEALIERLDERESLDLEFKAARGGLPKDLWPTVSAFANTRGGWILLGVAERNDMPSVEGVANPSELLQQFTNLVRNPQRVSYPVCGATDTTIETLGDRKLVVIRVPAAPRRVRPVYVGGNAYGGTFVRRHSGDFTCSKQEVDRMMREASDAGADTTILTGYGWNDLARSTFTRYRQRFQTARPGGSWNGLDDQAFLEAVGGFRQDRETGRTGLTVAGLLMFGTDEAILQWRTRHLIDFQHLGDGENPALRYLDRVVWEGNLLGAFETIYPRLTADLPVPFRLEGSQRIDESGLHVALREALVNLLVHADYAETGSSLIERSSEGYFLRNPGSSRVLEADLLSGGRSDPRNPAIVRMFRLVGLAEEAGMGVSEIARAWRALGFQLPGIDVGTERYEFSLRLRYAHLLSEEDRAWLLSLGGPWSEAEQLALVIARHEGGVDNPTVRQITGEHAADVTKILGGLRNRNLLRISGGGRSARYQLGPAALLRMSPLFANAERGQDHATSPSMEDSGQSMEDSGQSMEDSDHLVGAEPGKIEERVHAAWTELQHTAKTLSNRDRLDSEERDTLIVQLCAIVPLSRQELTILLDRSGLHLREVLRHLVHQGRLTYLYQVPRHPRQRYVATRFDDGETHQS